MAEVRLHEPSEVADRVGGVVLWATSVGAADLRPEDAARHIGETATVCGVVASAMFEADVQEQPTLLDLGEPSPHAIFTAVIYGDNRSKFGTPETSLRGKRICVTGQISDYHEKPEIVLRDSAPPFDLARPTHLVDRYRQLTIERREV